MPLNDRKIKVTISLPNGDVIIDESLKVNIRIHKAALAIQNKATIDVVGLSTALRVQLLSQFTAWHKRQVETGQASQDWINVQIEAGYASSNSGLVNSSAGASSTNNTSIIFIGQIVLCEPTSAPPNIGVRITAYSRQIDKTTYISSPAPAQTTFYQYVQWAAQQMGFGSNFICDTSYNDVQILNPARSILTTGALLIDIQNMYRPDVAAFIDDNQLIVKDRTKIIDSSEISNVTQFIGTPMWTEWGVNFACLFDPTIKLAGAANITSIMNPGVNGTYVILELEYDITSRDTPFYVRVGASPPA